MNTGDILSRQGKPFYAGGYNLLQEKFDETTLIQFFLLQASL